MHHGRGSHAPKVSPDRDQRAHKHTPVCVETLILTRTLKQALGDLSQSEDQAKCPHSVGKNLSTNTDERTNPSWLTALMVPLLVAPVTASRSVSSSQLAGPACQSKPTCSQTCGSTFSRCPPSFSPNLPLSSSFSSPPLRQLAAHRCSLFPWRRQPGANRCWCGRLNTNGGTGGRNNKKKEI